MNLFHYLNYGLSAILVFVGAKMLIADFYKFPIVVALGVIAGILAISIIASLLRPRKEEMIATPMPIMQPLAPSVEQR